MLKPNAGKLEWQIGAPVHANGQTVYVVKRMRWMSHREPRSFWVWAEKFPYAVLVRDQYGLQAYSMDATALTLEQLVERFPELIDPINSLLAKELVDAEIRS